MGAGPSAVVVAVGVPPATTKQAITRLQQVEEILDKRIDYLGKQYNELGQRALELKVKDRLRCMEALKRRKTLHSHMARMLSYKDQLFCYRLHLEQSTVNAQVFDAMKTSASALKEANKRVPVDQIDKLMDDAAEQLENANEVLQRLAEPVEPSNQPMYDEDDLERELKELELDRQLEKDPRVAATHKETEDYLALCDSLRPPKPRVSRPPPPNVVIVTEEEDDEDMRRLSESMTTPAADIVPPPKRQQQQINPQPAT